MNCRYPKYVLVAKMIISFRKIILTIVSIKKAGFIATFMNKNQLTKVYSQTIKKL